MSNWNNACDLLKSYVDEEDNDEGVEKGTATEDSSWEAARVGDRKKQAAKTPSIYERATGQATVKTGTIPAPSASRTPQSPGSAPKFKAIERARQGTFKPIADKPTPPIRP